MATTIEVSLTDALPLEFEFTTAAAPVQAEGTIAGRPFYFRARHDGWTFAVADQPEVDPVEIDSASAARGRGWFRSGTIGTPREYRASYLSADEAAAIIRRCAAEYMGGGSPNQVHMAAT